MRARWSLPIFFLIAAFSGARAAPATTEGAKAIEQDYIDYFSRAVVDKGIVTVTPSGEDYVVSWNLQKTIDLADNPEISVRVDPLVYKLTPRDGGWTVKADHLPSLTIGLTTDKGRMNGTVDFSGFHIETSFDAGRKDFLRSIAAADALTMKFHSGEAAAQPADIDLVEAGLSGETRVKTPDDGAGVDVAMAHSVTHLTETVISAPSSSDAGMPTKFVYDAGNAGGQFAVAGLRAREIADLWKYVLAHIKDAQAPPDLRQRVHAILPLRNDIHAGADVHDLVLTTSIGEARLKTFGETLSLTGFTADAAAEVGVKIDALAVKSPMLPAWAEQFSPASLTLGLRVADRGLDKVAELALADPSFGDKGDLSSETQDKIDQVLLSGAPKLFLSPSRLTTPFLDLAVEGEAGIEAGAPTGRFTVSADGLDKTITLIGEIAKSMPDAQNVALAMALVKGLATTGPDGRLVWKVEVSSSGDVTINGTPMPTGK